MAGDPRTTTSGEPNREPYADEVSRSLTLWSDEVTVDSGVRPEGPVAQVVARLRGESRGREARFTATAATARLWEEGMGLTLPLPGGRTVDAVVNLARRESGGPVRLGGSLHGGGSFSLSTNGSEWTGRILIPDDGRAYVVATGDAGEIRISERALDELVCYHLNKPPEEPQSAPRESEGEGAIPVLSSRPEAVSVVYIDLDGETVTDPDWNEGRTIVALRPYFSTEDVIEIWSRVAEDFSPFDLDVTTNRTRYDQAPVGRRMRVIVTPSYGWFESGAAGAAYLDSFARAGAEFASNITAWVFTVMPESAAEAISHEVGHTLGLSHDGLASPVVEYYEGHGTGNVSWAPIMGLGFNRAFTQWSKGEYSGANNQEDDLAIISGLEPTPLSGAVNRVGFVQDEAGGDLPAAATIPVSGGGFQRKGVISRGDDVDVYAVTLPAAQVSIDAEVARWSPNLIVRLEFLDGAGTVLAAADAAQFPGAGLSVVVPAGTYYVRVFGGGYGDPAGAGFPGYGTIGQYELSGVVAEIPPPVITSPTIASLDVGDDFRYRIAASSSPSSYGAIGLPDGFVVDPETGEIVGRPLAKGVYTFTVTATNLAGTGSATFALTAVSAAPIFREQPSGEKVVAAGSTVDLAVTAFSADGPVAYRWRRNGVALSGATGATLTLSNASLADSGIYVVTATNSIGLRHSVPFFVRVSGAASQVVSWGPYDLGAPILGDAQYLTTDGSRVGVLRPGGLLSMWRNGGAVVDGPTGVVSVKLVNLSGFFIGADGVVSSWNPSSLTIPSSIAQAVQVDAMMSTNFALTREGTIWSWGGADWRLATMLPGFSRVVALAVGGSHMLALKDDGTVVAWGNDYEGETVVPAGLDRVIGIAAGGRMSVALRDDGTVVTWGKVRSTTLVGEVVQLAVIGGATVALKKDGSLAVLGELHSESLRPPDGLGRVFGLAATGGEIVVLRDASSDTVPAVTNPQVALAIVEDEPAVFTVQVSGVGPFAYQWRKDGVPLAGETESSLTIPEVKRFDAGRYDVTVTNHVGTTTGAATELSVKPLPTVAIASTRRNAVVAGGTVEFAATASGTGALSYQWVHNGRPLAGRTSPAFSLAGVSEDDAGWYALRVSDDHGTRSSAPVFVIVAPLLTEVRGWGLAGSLDVDGPDELTDAIALSASRLGMLALRRDGTLVSWPVDPYGIYSVLPLGLSDLVAVHAGGNTVVALKAAGSVVAWNQQGAIPMPDLTDLAAISVSEGEIVGLRTNGRVVAWNFGQTAVSEPVPGLREVVFVGGAGGWGAAVTAGGNVRSWGNLPPILSLPETIGGTGKIVGAGAYLAIVDDSGLLRDSGGFDDYGYFKPKPDPIGLLKDVAVAPDHALALRPDGSILGWGRNQAGQAVGPEHFTHVWSLAVDEGRSFVLRDATNDTIPVILQPPASVVSLEEGVAAFAVGIAPGLKVSYQWQKDGADLAGATSAVLELSNLSSSDEGSYRVVVRNRLGSVVSSPASLAIKRRPAIAQLSATRHVLASGDPMALSVTATGQGVLRYQWYRNGFPVEGAEAPNFERSSVTAADAGWYTVSVTDDNGHRRSAPIFVKVAPWVTQVTAWGANTFRQLNVPGEANDLVEISAGSEMGLGLRREGTVVAWGRGAEAQGRPPAGLTDVVAVHASETNYALKADGTVVQWGSWSPAWDATHVAALAVVGSQVVALRSDGTVRAAGDAPKPPFGLAEVAAVAAGNGFGLALKIDGTVIAWGDNRKGQAAPPAGLNNVVAIAAGAAHGAALKRDGSVTVWGGVAEHGLTPPPDLPPLVAIKSGLHHLVGLTAEGKVVAWGRNDFGQSSPPTDIVSPFAVSGGSDFSLALSDYSAIAMKAPVILRQPRSIMAEVDGSVRFTVEAEAVPAPRYQWFVNGVKVDEGVGSGVAGNHYTIASVSGSLLITVQVSNPAGSVMSEPALLTVGTVTDPRIVRQPQHTKVRWGKDAVFSIQAEGSGTLEYRWQSTDFNLYQWKDVVDSDFIEGANQPTLRVRQRDQNFIEYSYRCIVTGPTAAVASPAVGATYDFFRPSSFDGDAYMARHPDTAAMFGHFADRLDRAWNHYIWTGWFYGYSDGNFDPEVFLAKNPDLNELYSGSKRAAILHWYYVSAATGMVPEGFDVAGYLERHPEHQIALGHNPYAAWLYFRDYGVYDGELYDDLFRPEEYLALYPELLAALGPDLKKALMHWLGEGRIEGRLGRIPLEFDVQGYFERNPDVAAAMGGNAILGWQHFWKYGIYEGRAYDDEFRAFEYLALNEDLQAAFLNDWRGATLHWLRYGRIEGRLGRVPPIFDVNFYLTQYPDVASVWGTYQSTVFLHYYFFGVYEARIFDNLFRVDEYIALNPDLQAVFGTDRRGAFMHWVRWGRSEGRPGRN